MSRRFVAHINGVIGGCNDKDASTPAIWNACESLTTNLETVITGLPIPSLSLVSSNVCGGYVYASYADSQVLPTTIWVENSGQRFGQRYTSALWDLAGQSAVRACVSQDNNPLAQFPLCTSWSAIASLTRRVAITAPPLARP